MKKTTLYINKAFEAKIKDELKFKITLHLKKRYNFFTLTCLIKCMK